MFNRSLEVKIWDSRHFQQSKYAVVHEESESEVKNSNFLSQKGKNRKNDPRTNSNKFALCFLVIKSSHGSFEGRH